MGKKDHKKSSPPGKPAGRLNRVKSAFKDYSFPQGRKTVRFICFPEEYQTLFLDIIQESFPGAVGLTNKDNPEWYEVVPYADSCLIWPEGFYEEVSGSLFNELCVRVLNMEGIKVRQAQLHEKRVA